MHVLRAVRRRLPGGRAGADAGLTQDFEMATYTRDGQIWDRQMLEEGPKPTQYKC
ncbi:fragment of NADH-quinone oxidoreductase subunit I (part 2/2) [Candidatus Sulfopaludibacter sp. SbA4]|nr:fragment of NADH-quinone oxidoreductase subunit I (part 2/2) [Candidatus Sulfopaludibacter sp. SbA4]